MPSPSARTTTENPRGNRPMLAIPRRPRTHRRGITLVEMLVVVALVVLMMTILVQIFQATAGTMQASRTIQELDLSLRLLDQTIRQDLRGATARFTPPLNPINNLGYFEYGENAYADVQGEDGDDYLAFTTRAPEGQVFTGRQWLTGSVTDATGKTFATVNQNVQPTTITSRVAEVVYFLRNGNLYRRTFLVVPEREKSISSGTTGGGLNFTSSMFGSPMPVSWLGMNDISARPAGNFTDGTVNLIPVPNTLGALTNRENRAFRPRFSNDFNRPGGGTTPQPDGLADDLNGDGVPDYYPTLYYDGGVNNGNGGGWGPNGYVRDSMPFPTGLGRVQPAGALYDIYAFPFIYPGMYSVPANAGTNLGWIHQLYPNGGVLNHAPLETGDVNLPTANQTWYGFPTWRETMTGVRNATNVGWTDPLRKPSSSLASQSVPLRPFNPGSAPALTDPRFPPPVSVNGTQNRTPFGFDGAGSATLAPINATPGVIWEDDLVMTNVRSFDVKALDPSAPLYRLSTATVPGVGVGYHDLGYASDPLLSGQTGGLDLTGGLNAASYNSNAYLFQNVNNEPSGFGHEGRIPPVTTDGRIDPRRPGTIIGDDATGVIRLRRTFDTWSTDYTNAPETDILLNGYPPATPVYPAFPAPYPSPLRGIQIQIRVADPRNERVKVLTIRQDFIDKL